MGEEFEFKERLIRYRDPKKKKIGQGRQRRVSKGLKGSTISNPVIAFPKRYTEKQTGNQRDIDLLNPFQAEVGLGRPEPLGLQVGLPSLASNNI